MFPFCQGHQKPVNDTKACQAYHTVVWNVSARYSLWTVKFWLKKVDSQLPRLQDLIFGNQETRQLELWNLAQWEILLIVPGKVLWRKCIGGLGGKINRALMWNHYRSSSPCNKTQKLELGQNSTQSLKNFKTATCDKIPQLKLWQNSTTQIVTNLKNSNSKQTNHFRQKFLLRSTWNLDHWWDVFEAAICNLTMFIIKSCVQLLCT